MPSLRSLLLALFTLSTLGLLAELLLLGHYEDEWQWVPVGLLLMGVALCLAQYTWSRQWLTRLFRGFSLLLMGAAFVGIYLHYQGNKAFELEMYPDLSGSELIWETLTGATPALSPGALFVLGTIGWMYSKWPD